MASTGHRTPVELPPIVVPFNGTEAELIQAGRDVAALIETPGFEHVLEAAESLARIRDNTLGQAPPTDNVAAYADLMGEKRGLRSFERLTKGIIANAKQVEQQAKED